MMLRMKMLGISAALFFCSMSVSAMDMGDVKKALKRVDPKTAGKFYLVRVGDGDSASQTMSPSADRAISYSKKSVTFYKKSKKYYLTVSADAIVSISHEGAPGKPLRILIK